MDVLTYSIQMFLLGLGFLALSIILVEYDYYEAKRGKTPTFKIIPDLVVVAVSLFMVWYITKATISVGKIPITSIPLEAYPFLVGAIIVFIIPFFYDRWRHKKIDELLKNRQVS